MARIINVANRLPVTVGDTIKKSAGGLVAAMDGLTGSRFELQWIGWPGATVDDYTERKKLTQKLEHEYDFKPIFLTEEEMQLYYHGFSNSSLWPILHYMPMYMRHETAWWEAYRRINERFAHTVLETAEDDDIVWVHDYHLMLLPTLLRASNRRLRIGFFLHTPFPSYEIFRCHPQRVELLEGLLGADQIGFHTFGYLRHFHSSVLRVLGVETEMNHIPLGRRYVRTGVYPIGINAAKFERQLASGDHARQLSEYRERYKGRQVVLSVERLDYTKGIVHRLQAIDRFLETYEHKDGICFVMISVPSRGEVEEYQRLRDEVEHLVGKINGKHATVDNAPVHFIFQSVDFTQLCALYCLADIALVTPLIDGMNLVAKEYVACRQEETGMLILSEFAGAAQELFDAVIVNPYDMDDVVTKLHEALALAKPWKTGRMRLMRQRVLRNDARVWAKKFLDELDTHDFMVDAPIEGAEAGEEIVSAVVRATRPIALCLDYDGSLREFENDPDAASPTPEILDLLEKLDARGDVETWIISGRKRDDLERWFGHLGITLVSEHGMRYRSGATREWKEVIPNVDLTWKEDVLPVLAHYEDSTPGSRIEEKTSSVVWHYRRSDPEFGKWKASQLIGELTDVIANLPVEVHYGKAIVEVNSMQVSKGKAIEQLLAKKGYGLVLCCGDDQTDESMFAAQIDHLISVKIGPGNTAARYRVSGPAQFRGLLARIIDTLDDKPATKKVSG